MKTTKQNAHQSASKMQGRKSSDQATHIVAKNISITLYMARQGYLTMEIPEIEIWREQK